MEKADDTRKLLDKQANQFCYMKTKDNLDRFSEPLLKSIGISSEYYKDLGYTSST